MDAAKTDPKNVIRLEEMVKKYGTIRPDGLSLDLSGDPARWDGLIRAMGRKNAYAELARLLCRDFRLQNGRELIFTEACVAYELGWHIDAYLRIKGFPGHPRPLLSRAFSRAAVDRHCRSVEIDEKDVNDLRQRIVFRYRRGLRESCSPRS